MGVSKRSPLGPEVTGTAGPCRRTGTGSGALACRRSPRSTLPDAGPAERRVGTAPGSRRRAVSPTLTAVSSWTRELPHGEGLDVLPSASSGSQTGRVCVLWDRVGLFPERRCFSVPRARGGPVRVESECCSASSAGWARTRRRRRPHGERPVVGAVAGGGAVLPPAATETLRHGLWLRPCVCLQFLSDVW